MSKNCSEKTRAVSVCWIKQCLVEFLPQVLTIYNLAMLTLVIFYLSRIHTPDIVQEIHV